MPRDSFAGRLAGGIFTLLLAGCSDPAAFPWPAVDGPFEAAAPVWQPGQWWNWTVTGTRMGNGVDELDGKVIPIEAWTTAEVLAPWEDGRWVTVHHYQESDRSGPPQPYLRLIDPTTMAEGRFEISHEHSYRCSQVPCDVAKLSLTASDETGLPLVPFPLTDGLTWNRSAEVDWEGYPAMTGTETGRVAGRFLMDVAGKPTTVIHVHWEAQSGPESDAAARDEAARNRIPLADFHGTFRRTHDLWYAPDLGAVVRHETLIEAQMDGEWADPEHAGDRFPRDIRIRAVRDLHATGTSPHPPLSEREILLVANSDRELSEPGSQATATDLDLAITGAGWTRTTAQAQTQATFEARTSPLASNLQVRWAIVKADGRTGIPYAKGQGPIAQATLEAPGTYGILFAIFDEDGHERTRATATATLHRTQTYTFDCPDAALPGSSCTTIELEASGVQRIEGNATADGTLRRQAPTLEIVGGRPFKQTGHQVSFAVDAWLDTDLKATWTFPTEVQPTATLEARFVPHALPRFWEWGPLEDTRQTP